MNELYETASQYLTQLSELLGDFSWILQLFLVVLVVLVANFIARRALAKLERRLHSTANPWDNAVVEAVRKPLPVLIWVFGLAFAADMAGQHTDAVIFNYVDAARQIGVISVLIWLMLRLVTTLENNFAIANAEQGLAALDITTLQALGKLVRIAIVITGVLIALQTMGYSITGLLAFGGVGGIAVGYAAKDMLANLFGGLTVYMDRPFLVGDWIRSPDRNIEGTVERIGWRSTVIRTFDKRPLYVPNSVFLNISVENPSRMTNRRISETIGIRYDDAQQVSAIVEAVRQMLDTHDAIDNKQTLIVNFNAFAASSLDLMIYAFTKTTAWVEYHEVKHALLLEIYAIIQAHEAEVAYPTQTLQLQGQLAATMQEENAAEASKQADSKPSTATSTAVSAEE